MLNRCLNLKQKTNNVFNLFLLGQHSCGGFMNKNEFVDVVKSKSGLSKKDCKLCLDTILEVITDALKHGDSVTLSNFGKFRVSEIKAKPMYSFVTKKTRIVKARKAPSFRASENLKQVVK